MADPGECITLNQGCPNQPPTLGGQSRDEQYGGNTRACEMNSGHSLERVVPTPDKPIARAFQTRSEAGHLGGIEPRDDVYVVDGSALKPELIS
jgi:hypothetical protein